MDVQERAGRQRPGRPTDQKLTCESDEARVYRKDEKHKANKRAELKPTLNKLKNSRNFFIKKS